MRDDRTVGECTAAQGADSAVAPVSRPKTSSTGRRSILVLGMHRSGTSALTRVINLLGAELPRELIRPNPVSNKAGYWEPREIVELHDRLLLAAGSRWDDVRRLPTAGFETPEARRIRDEILAILRRDIASAQLSVIKDPRLCRLVPFWLPILDELEIDPAFVLSIRNPLEVAASLRARDGFHWSKSFLLWLRHLIDAERDTRNSNRSIVTFDNLVDDWRGVRDRLAADLDLVWPSTGPERTMEIQAFLKADLRHHEFRVSDLESDEVVDWVERAFAAACRAASGQSATELSRVLNEIGPEFEKASSAFGPALAEADEQVRTVSERVQELKERAGEREEQVQELEKRAQDLESLRLDLKNRDRKIGQFKRLLEYRSNKEREAHQRLKNEAQQRLGELSAQLHRTIADRDEEIARLGRDLKEQQGDVRRLRSRLDKMERSTSWRVTAPLRSAATALGYAGKQGRIARTITEQALRRGPKAAYRLLRDRRLLLASPAFDVGYYLRRNADVARARIDPALHYLLFGAAEGWDPSAAFRSAAYLSANPDVRAAGVNPLVHYLRHGMAEGRSMRPLGQKGSATTMPAGGPSAASPLRTVKPSNRHGKRIAVYTAIVGGYDALKFPEIVSPDCDYICFTDAPIADPGVWELCSIDYFNADATRIARYVKTHPHVYLRDYEWSIWVDANLLIRGDMSEVVSAMPEGSLFASFHHPKRDCVYDEANVVIELNLDDPRVVGDQMKRYRKDGYPPRAGLTETNVLVRRHNHPDVVDLDTDWWREIENGSRRDQLSLDYVAWKRGFATTSIAPYGTSARNDKRFGKVGHGATSNYRHSAKALEAARRAPRREDAPPAPKRLQDRRQAFEHLKVDVVVCVHNSLEDVERCLDAVQRFRSARQRLIVVDDGSDDEARRYLERFLEDKPTDLLIRHEQALGYTKAANAGLQTSSGDYVVLLNSDAIVSEEWIEKILECGESSADIGIVGPMSNAASWQSVPELLDDKGELAVNELLPQTSIDQMSRLCEQWSSGIFPRVPLVNGFCFAIKRSVIEKIGGFDEAAFPHGYGEENDYCFRALDAGFVGAIATHAYVFHAKSKSFTHERRRILSKQGSSAFRARYPASRINTAILTMKSHPELAHIRTSARDWARGILRTGPDQGFGTTMPDGQVMAFEDTKRPDLIRAYDVSTEILEQNAALIERFRAHPRLELNHVLWIVPSFDHIFRGGIYTIFRVAEGFSRRFGTSNTIVLHSGRKAERLNLERMIKATFPNLKFQLTAVSDWREVDDLPPSDAAFCTLWTSAYLLVRYNKCKGKFYFIQDFEPAFFAAGSTYGLIEQTYRFGFNGIANTPGVGELYRQYNPWVEYFVPGVDKSVFYPDTERGARSGGSQRVVFYGRPRNDRNAFELGVEALRIVKRELGDRVEIVSAGADFSVSEYGLQGILENRGVLQSIKDVAALYRSSDVGLVFMYTAHPSYQPFEYMASGCATVSNYNQHTQWFLRDRENAVLAESTATCVAERILEVLADPDLRMRVVAGGLSTAAKLEWDDALERIQNFVRHASPAQRTLMRTATDALDSFSSGAVAGAGGSA